MTAIEDRHIVLLCHLVDRGEQRSEVLLRVDVLLTMGRQQDVLALFQPQTGMDVTGLDLGQMLCSTSAMGEPVT